MATFSGLDTATRQKLDARVLAVFDAAVSAGDATLQAQADALREYLYGPDATAETALALVRTFELLAASRLNTDKPASSTVPRTQGPRTDTSTTAAPATPPPSSGVLALAAVPKAGLPLWLWLALGGVAVGLYVARKR